MAIQVVYPHQLPCPTAAPVTPTERRANDATPMLARLAWQDALTFERHSPTVAGMAQALGLSGEAIDQLFITAAQIEA